MRRFTLFRPITYGSMLDSIHAKATAQFYYSLVSINNACIIVMAMLLNFSRIRRIIIYYKLKHSARQINRTIISFETKK